MPNEMRPYTEVLEVVCVGDKRLFPISWLHKQGFCEYQIFLENIQAITVEPTRAMIEGKQEHEVLHSQFMKEAVPATLPEMVSLSRTTPLSSRELHVKDVQHGVYGLIDEVLFMPGEFIVIDDKPGTKPFLSDIQQVYGYCLAFREAVKPADTRLIVAALRKRGTKNIYWKAPFDQQAEEQIAAVISRIHSLISGEQQFSSAKNPNKCKGCKLNRHCDRAIQ